MYPYILIDGMQIPSYSICVMLGIVICNLIAFAILRKRRMSYGSFVQIEVLGGIAAKVGAKLLWLLEMSLKDGCNRFTWQEFSSARHSYFGGLAFFLFVVWIYFWKRKEDGKDYARQLMFLLPLLHAFWKIGCLFGGCCGGKVLLGILPIQLLEAIVDLFICGSLLFFRRKEKYHPVASYPLLYGFARLFLESGRYHGDTSGRYFGYICAMVCLCIGMLLMIYKNKREKDE